MGRGVYLNYKLYVFNEVCGEILIIGIGFRMRRVVVATLKNKKTKNKTNKRKKRPNPAQCRVC